MPVYPGALTVHGRGSRFSPVVSQFLWYCLFVQFADECYLPEPIMSISKDEASRPVLNAILMHMHRERRSEAEAIAAVARWHNQLIGEFMQTAREAVRSFGALDERVERYARGVQNRLRGSIEWMLRGGATPCPRPVRYASARSSGRMPWGDSNPEARRNEPSGIHE
jgi:hypothetical protein